MPTPTEILHGLATIANDAISSAILWHVLIAIAVIGLLMGWRPTRKWGATYLAIPLVSVSILAVVYINPFNGVVFLIFAVILVITGLRLPNEKVQAAPLWGVVFGALMILFGFSYPHFLEGGSWLVYLYAAPTGLIPCPTLSFTIGFALLANGFGSRLWSITLVIIGIFYGLFGFFRLAVHLDIILLIGSLILFIQAFISKSNKPSKTATV